MQRSLLAVWGGFVAAAVLALLFLSFFGTVPPGVAVAILGGLAVWLTLVPPKEPSKGETAFWLGCAFCLMLIEIMAITHDRRQQNENFSRTAEALQTTVDQSRAIMQQEADARGLLQRIQQSQLVVLNAETSLLHETENAEVGVKQTAKLAGERQLKIRALDLARDISELVSHTFLAEAALPMLPPAHSLQEMQAQENSPLGREREAREWQILHNAYADFHNKFGSSVRDVLDEFKKQKNWESKECSTALTVNAVQTLPNDLSPIMPETIQFLYVEGCAGDLEREADTLP